MDIYINNIETGKKKYNNNNACRTRWAISGFFK